MNDFSELFTKIGDFISTTKDISYGSSEVLLIGFIIGGKIKLIDLLEMDY